MSDKRLLEDFVDWVYDVDPKGKIFLPEELVDKFLLSPQYYPTTKQSDCTCWGDSTGFATNPQCILHGSERD